MKKEKSKDSYGDPEVECSAPKGVEEIYEAKGETAKLVNLFTSNPEAFGKAVEKPFFVDTTGLTTLNGKPARRISIVLKSPGCSKRRANCTSNSYPNCPFCVFSENLSTGGNPVTAEQYEQQMKNAIKQIKPGELTSNDIFEIFNSGSFFNETEIYKKARKKITDVLRNNSRKDSVLTVESKFSDLVSLDSVDEVLKWLNSDGGNRKLEIAFGLETTDQLFGEEMQKSVDPETLANMIRDLANKEVRTFFYILVKPGLMSERNAIDSAFNSIKQIAMISKQLKLPAKLKPHISLSPTRVYAKSLLHAYKSFHAPKFWAVAEIIKSLNEDNLGNNDKALDYIGLHSGLSGESMPIVTGGNPKTGSKQCNNALEKMLKEYNYNMDAKKFLDSYKSLLEWDKKSCGCYKEWLSQLNDIPVEIINTTDQVILRKQLNEVMTAEVNAWPKEVQATITKFESRHNVFPQGFMLGYESGIVAGVATAELTHFEKNEYINSWEDICNDGFILPVYKLGKIIRGHDPKGNSLYIVSLGVRKDFKGQGIGGALIEAEKKLVKEMNLKYLFLGSRVPCFAKAKRQNPKMTIEEFVAAKDSQGRLLDDDVRFYAKHGLKISQIQKNYMEDDPESFNYGVVMYWKNPEYKE